MKNNVERPMLCNTILAVLMESDELNNPRLQITFMKSVRAPVSSLSGIRSTSVPEKTASGTDRMPSVNSTVIRRMVVRPGISIHDKLRRMGLRTVIHCADECALARQLANRGAVTASTVVTADGASYYGT